MNKQRKDKLAKRAIAYGKREHPDHILTVVWAASDGFERGYREAMRDMRRVVQRAQRKDFRSFGGTLSDETVRLVRIFLLPLR